MDQLQAQLYGVLLGQGLLWVLGHCPAMCGPLVVALRFQGLPGLLAYQAGKGVTYAIVGGLAGGLGGIAILALRAWAPLVLGACAVGMVAMGIAGVLGRGHAAGVLPAWLRHAVQRFTAGAQSGSRRSAFVLGLLLAGLPCAVVVWALGLAVASASPLHGAALMLLLVVLNTPVLLAAQLLGAGAWLAAVRLRLQWLPPCGLIAGGAWLAWQAWHVGAPGCVA
jgi:sulfite exporter TauE/SafE